MTLCRQRLALLLVVALSALALSAAVTSAGSGTSAGGSMGDASFAVRAPRLDGSLTRLSGDERRDGINTERTLKQRLVLFAVLTLSLCAACLVGRRFVVGGVTYRPATTWWSPHTGRSPPSPFSTAIT